MLTFPTHLFNPARVRVSPVKVVISGGEALDGSADVIQRDGGGRWQVALLGMELTSPDLVRAFRAWEDELAGGGVRVLVPVADVRQAPRPIVAGKPGRPSEILATADDPYFPEAVGFATPWIEASVTAPAAERATQIEITVTRGQRTKGGEFFSVDHPTVGRRLYRLGRVISRTGQTAVHKVSPPLREAVADNSPADFDWPSVPATLLPGTETSPELLYGATGTVDLVFLEAR